MKKTKLKEIEKKYGVDFEAHPNMNLETWLKRKGFGSLARLLKRTEYERNKSKKS